MLAFVYGISAGTDQLEFGCELSRYRQHDNRPEISSTLATGWKARMVLPVLAQWTGAVSIIVNCLPRAADSRWITIACRPSNTEKFRNAGVSVAGVRTNTRPIFVVEAHVCPELLRFCLIGCRPKHIRSDRAGHSRMARHLATRIQYRYRSCFGGFRLLMERSACEWPKLHGVPAETSLSVSFTPGRHCTAGYCQHNPLTSQVTRLPPPVRSPAASSPRSAVRPLRCRPRCSGCRRATYR